MSWAEGLRAANAEWLPCRASIIASLGLGLGLEEAEVAFQLVSVRLTFRNWQGQFPQAIHDCQAVPFAIHGVLDQGQDNQPADPGVGLNSFDLSLEDLQTLGDRQRRRFLTVRHSDLSSDLQGGDDAESRVGANRSATERRS